MRSIFHILFGKSLAKILASRKPVSLRELYIEYDGRNVSSFEEWSKYWIEIAYLLKVDPCKLRLTDRFENLASEEGWFGVDTSMEALDEWVKHEFTKQNKSIIVEDLNTLRDLLDSLFIWPLLRD